MNPWPARLRTRLYLSHAITVAVGVVTMMLVGVTVTRSVYQGRLGGFGLGRGPGRGQTVNESELTAALDRSLWPAMLAGTAAALLVAAPVVWLIARRLLRSLDEVRHTAQRLAAGDLEARVQPPEDADLASLADDVNALGERLASTERARSQLLGEVTHEMRTPLTVLDGHLEGLLDGVIEPTPETFSVLAGETRRLERLVDDLTTLSRADEGTLAVELEPLDLAEVVAATVRRLQPQFEHADVALELRPGRALAVRGDAQRLAQVLSNVIGNALEHTPAGGSVVVTCGADEVAWVEVTDTGHGITPADLDAIFERFHRGSNAVAGRRSGARGRGIGLTISRSLARAHGGDLVATSPGLGHGATFRLTLPNA